MSLNSIDPIEFQMPELLGMPLGAVFAALPGHRVTVRGSGAGRETLLASTNGEPHVIKWPKNTGPTSVFIYCVDRQWIYIDNTALNLPPGAQLESYTSPRGAYRILFYAEKSDEEGRCELELDR